MLIAVPSAPANIKAAASAPNKILVAWLPPSEPNGVLVGYTLYISEEGKDGVRKKVLNSGTESHELVREDAPMKFWLTASTTVGEGESTKVVLVIPTTKGACPTRRSQSDEFLTLCFWRVAVPARIISFGRELATAWKQDLQLPCKKVGVPDPMGSWRLRGRTLETGGRKQLNPDGSLTIRDVQSTDEGNYTCKVENNLGTDEISYFVRVRGVYMI